MKSGQLLALICENYNNSNFAFGVHNQMHSEASPKPG